MEKEKIRVERALNKALEYLEHIIEYATAPEFVEITGRMGGDVITYRIYDDGSIYER